MKISGNAKKKTLKLHYDATYWPDGIQRGDERNYDGEVSNVEVNCPEEIEDTSRIIDIYTVDETCKRTTT